MYNYTHSSHLYKLITIVRHVNNSSAINYFANINLSFTYSDFSYVCSNV